ncbi:MAG TPA: alpha/beta fold hydrolase [Longimicrobium sp.]|nr:alpha/beta fold hydrolase [Longimicrobium sp.]
MRSVTLRSRRIVLALAAATAAVPGFASAQEAARLSTTAATVADSLVGFHGRTQDAELTTLTIRQRWGGAGDTATVQVAYLRLPARTASPGSPIVFLMGGPGVPGSAIGRVPPYWALFERLRAGADVILLDPRGVGMSRPGLDCAAATPPHADFLASQQALADALVAAYAPCVAAFRARGIRPELFSVAEVARDVEAIRRHLGVPRISLLGFSYGTRMALEYARRFPGRVDRVVLQGVMAPDDAIRTPTAMDSVLAAVSAAAARDSVARALAPDLRASVAGLLRQVDAAPLRVTVAGARGDSVPLTVGRGGLEALVGGRLSDPRLPALVATLRAGDTRVLAMLAGGIYRDLAAGGGSLFGRTAYCSAPATEARERLALRLAARSALGEVFDNVPESSAFCRRIGITPGARPTPPRTPIAATALLITGTLDDRTPPANAERARSWFADAKTVIVENGGHELLPDDAVQALVAAFFATGRVDRDRIVLPPWRFLGVAEALQPPRRR